MADSVDAATAATNVTQVPAKKTKSAGKKPRAKPVHPRTSEMVANAISSLKERGGSSLQAIKKYIAANYKVDSEKLSPFIKKYLKTAVASGELVQTKGKGASGSFKLAVPKSEKAAVSTAPPRARGGASTGPKQKKQHAAKAKAKSPKKPAVKRTPEKKKRVPAAKPKKSPSKVKKAAKVPTKKPKAPRPKTAVKPKAPKKASPKKK
ncbi:hypothetical protein Cfor_03267 [Coptotermes formosanus]|jgi:hypothetical protein|uniref:H15 domain-containing protein n=1 Tax=Coptotermes formosanus TaxID=36987 RepID=A0A6L2PFF7_COPFO|nr:hypothetical protein Cfor_03267 [Coptotermes formosanus]